LLGKLVNSSVSSSRPVLVSTMPKKTSKKRKSSTNANEFKARTSLPKDLEERLRVVWRRLGHLIDWCDSSAAWTRLFRSEARPYRATFYWEAVAEIVSDYMLDHPTASPEDVLADCLVAIQYSQSSDDPAKLTDFRESWDEIMCSSKEEIEAFIQSDLELAKQEGTYETVTSLYTANDQKREKGEARWEP
jgi:hypothetical protein